MITPLGDILKLPWTIPLFPRKNTFYDEKPTLILDWSPFLCRVNVDLLFFILLRTKVFWYSSTLFSFKVNLMVHFSLYTHMADYK